MPDFIVNDQWIMDRISSQSTSFNNWISELIHSIENTFEEINNSQIPFIEMGNFKKGMAKTQNKITRATKKLAAIPIINNILFIFCLCPGRQNENGLLRISNCLRATKKPIKEGNTTDEPRINVCLCI